MSAFIVRITRARCLAFGEIQLSIRAEGRRFKVGRLLRVIQSTLLGVWNVEKRYKAA